MSDYGTKYGGTPLTPEEKLGNMTPEAFADWMIEFHGLNPASKGTVVSNIADHARTNRALGFVEGNVRPDENTLQEIKAQNRRILELLEELSAKQS
jgi:hypothetical protein